jgi:GGDEF domain-containing protein
MRARLDRAVAAYNARPDRLARLSLSMGVASADPRAAGSLCSLAALMVEADEQLYEEKRARKAGPRS